MITTDHKLEWFGTSRARLGVLWSPNILAYGTFGVAYGQVNDSATITVAGLGSATGTFKDVKAGWAAGAGLESAFGGGWSGKLEYLYIDLGDTERTFATPALGTILTDTRRTTDNIVRVGLNYRWGGYGAGSCRRPHFMLSRPRIHISRLHPAPPSDQRSFGVPEWKGPGEVDHPGP
jgi:outer membrane immunogenic protein